LIRIPIDLLVSAAQRFLKQELSENLAYHSVGHTLSVINYSRLLSQKEQLSDSDQALVCLAAAYHDTGFCVMQKANEPIGAFLLSSALHYVMTNQRIAPSIKPINSAFDLAELDESVYITKSLAMRESLIAIIDEIKEEHSENQPLMMDSTLEGFVERMTLMINSTALLKSDQGLIYRIPSESLTEVLLDADLSGLGTEAYATDFEDLISERELQTLDQQMDFALGSVALLKNHKWFTRSAYEMFHQQQEKNLSWTEAYIVCLDKKRDSFT